MSGKGSQPKFLPSRNQPPEWDCVAKRAAMKPGVRGGDSTYGVQFSDGWFDEDEVDLMAEGLFEAMLLERS